MRKIPNEPQGNVLQGHELGDHSQWNKCRARLERVDDGRGSAIWADAAEW